MPDWAIMLTIIIVVGFLTYMDYTAYRMGIRCEKVTFKSVLKRMFRIKE